MPGRGVGWPQDQSALSGLIDSFDDLATVNRPEEADFRALKSASDQVGHR